MFVRILELQFSDFHTHTPPFSSQIGFVAPQTAGLITEFSF